MHAIGSVWFLKGVTEIKKTHRIIIVIGCILLSLLFLSCSNEDNSDDDVNKVEITKMIQKDNSIMEESYISTYNMPPFVINIEGDWFIIEGEGTDEDYSNNVEGYVTAYTGNVMDLPIENGKTNYEEFVNCEYASVNGKRYLHYQHKWMPLYNNSEECRNYNSEFDGIVQQNNNGSNER